MLKEAQNGFERNIRAIANVKGPLIQHVEQDHLRLVVNGLEPKYFPHNFRQSLGRVGPIKSQVLVCAVLARQYQSFLNIFLLLVVACFEKDYE